MSSCIDCKEHAERAGNWHGYTRGCRDCLIRGLAAGTHYQRVKQNQSQDRRYLAVLLGHGVTHAEVKEAAGDA
jgi:hypothetical protein